MTLLGPVRQESRRTSLPVARLALMILAFMVTSLGQVPGAMAVDLLVSGFVSGQVLKFQAGTGAPLGTFASGVSLDGPAGLTIGPKNNHRIQKFASVTTSTRRMTWGALKASVERW